MASDQQDEADAEERHQVTEEGLAPRHQHCSHEESDVQYLVHYDESQVKNLSAEASVGFSGQA